MTRCLAIASLVLATGLPAAAGAADDAVTRWNVGAWTVWRVDRPAFRAGREYPEIRFQPGDRVLVDAGGCAASGEAALGGATDGLVPLRGVLRRELRVPEGAAPATLRVAGACRDAQAWMMVGVRHADAAEPLPLPRPLDLVSNGVLDANGIPLNPKWGLQQTQPGVLPNPVELCFDVPGWFDNPICTVQRPSMDQPVGVKNAICGIGSTTPINGHVNWFAGTYEGPAYWEGKFWSDQDVNIGLVPPGRSGLTTDNPESIHSEFDARETLHHFTTPWWNELRQAANRGAQAAGRALVDGRRTVLTGLVGLDCEHGCGTELHPVWAMALQAEAEAAQETWALFARNWGNEGFCSSQQHLLELVGHRISVTVPWREGATGVRLGRKTKFLANVEGVAGWWTPVPGRHVTVTFQLPAPAARGRVHGELALRWTGPAAPPEPGSTAMRPRRERGEGPEHLVQELVEGMTPVRRRALERLEPRAAATPDLVPVTLTRGAPPSLGQVPVFAPAVRSVADPGRDVDDLRRIEALVELHSRRLPGALGELPALLDPR